MRSKEVVCLPKAWLLAILLDRCRENCDTCGQEYRAGDMNYDLDTRKYTCLACCRPRRKK